jgi:hypothetical protein
MQLVEQVESAIKSIHPKDRESYQCVMDWETYQSLVLSWIELQFKHGRPKTVNQILGVRIMYDPAIGAEKFKIERK